MKITVYGRGGHGSMPQNTVDPVLAALIIVRLQTVVSREVAPGETAVLTVGSCQAGTKSNVIPDRAVLQLNLRSYSQLTYRDAEKAGRLQDDIPVNHSPKFLPVLQPTLRTGTEALVTAALAWLAPQSGS